MNSAIEQLLAKNSLDEICGDENPPIISPSPGAHPALPLPLPSPGQIHSQPPVPCLICENPGLWESIYRDGIFRCPECDPWPARAFVGGFWMLVLDSENSDRPAGYRWEAIFAGASETVYDDRRDSHPLAVDLTPENVATALPGGLARGSAGELATTLVDLPGQPCPYCRRSTKFRDTEIHNGLAVRRDCAACKKFVGFPVWDGSG